MGSRGNFSDPTANQAIRNADHDRRRRDSPLVQAHPEVFAGLTEEQMRLVGLRAFHLAGNNPDGITDDHLERARAEVLA